MSEEWQMKTRRNCPNCFAGFDAEDDPCKICDGTGQINEIIPIADIPTFLERPDKAEFTCVCKKVESILRPTQGQIPSGWLNWDGDYICNNCKYLIMFAALNAAAQKVQQLKEKK